MKDSIDVVALAKLARLELSDDEVVKLAGEVTTILGFVETIQSIQAPAEIKGQGHHNVLRGDENAIEGGTFTDVLLDAAPAREGNRVVVKQVISRTSAKGTSAEGK